MNNVLDYLKIAFAAIGGALGWLFGGFDALIYALISFVVIDYVTGVMVAIHNKKVSSAIGFRGISKKVMIFLLVAIGNVIDQYIVHTGSVLRTMIIMFYIANEGISIVENASKIGLPIPKRLKRTLQQLCERDCDSDKNIKSNNNNDNK